MSTVINRCGYVCFLSQAENYGKLKKKKKKKQQLSINVDETK